MLNNQDFKRLLTADDTALVKELTKAKKRKSGAPAKRENPAKRHQKSSRNDEGKVVWNKGKRVDPEEFHPLQPQVRDRAEERRKGIGEFKEIEGQLEDRQKLSVADSQRLGGDEATTHMVKGLDYLLLEKKRRELEKEEREQRAREEHIARKQRTHAAREHQTPVAKGIFEACFKGMHPHHVTYRERSSKLLRFINLGQHLQGASKQFQAGRMWYSFETDPAQNDGGEPTSIMGGGEDVGTDRRVNATVDHALVARVQVALGGLLDKRKRGREGAGESKQERKTLIPKIAAKDADENIFGDVGEFNASDLLPKDEARNEAAVSGNGAGYFEDDGKGDSSKPVRYIAASRDDKPRKGYEFRRGSLGIGYYLIPVKAAQSSHPANALLKAVVDKGKREDRKQQVQQLKGQLAHRTSSSGYDECFPEGGLFKHNAKEELAQEALEKKLRKKGKLKGKKGDDGGDSDYEAPSPKKSKAQKKQMEDVQWARIESMIEKRKNGGGGGFRGIDAMEVAASKQTASAPTFG
mmetsp:Transcript_28230/g.60102  ORF Transcript_28230/g.60102 Transcript_28230/m.60102 type:complete len:523 (+) Transcript_28230:24-1592(+)